MSSFHNTTHESPPQLDLYERKARTQEERVLWIFRAMYTHAGISRMTPSEVAWHVPGWPITSVRRAMTNLTRQGKLRRTSQKRTGPHGRPEYVWVRA